MIKYIFRDPDFYKYKSGKKSASFPRIMRKGGIRITLVCFLLFFLSLFLPWTQTIRGSGRVIAYSPNERSQSIDSPVYGRLGEWFVEEGSFVKKGDPVVQILDNDPDLVERLKSQKETLVTNREAIAVSAENSEKHFLRMESLLKKGIVSQRDYEKSKIEYNKFLAEEAKVNAQLIKIETEITRQSAQLVTSPRDGIIQRRLAGSGSQLVKAGDRLALLVPDTNSRAVEIFLSGNDAPFIRKDSEVRIQFEGWPAIQSFGWPSLAKGTFGGKVAFVDEQLDEKGYTRILITPNPEQTPWPDSKLLRQGSRVYAWVLLNRVSLGFELWRKFNGFPQIISQEDLYSNLKDKGSEAKPQKSKEDSSLDYFLKEEYKGPVFEEKENKKY